MGHSVGAYMVKECMNRLKHDPTFINLIHKFVFLFPTISNIGITPRAKLMNPLIQNGRHLLKTLFHTLSFLPLKLKRRISTLFIENPHDTYN